MKRIGGAIALSFVVFTQGMAADGVTAPAATPAPLPTLAPILKKITPAVVKIEIRGRVTTTTNSRRRETRQIHEVGSGVVYDASQGLIITNHHVIDHADEITVMFTDGRILKAKRLGSDPDFDVAMIKVQADNLPSIPFGDSSQLQVGDIVLAIGYPMNMEQSVTSGIVGGLHRTNIGLEQHENFIQTDAAVYPGNSGGALVDIKGNLVGINAAFIGSTNSNPGVGFAIPINMSRTIANQILKFGDIRRGTLGITIEDPTPAVIRDMKLTGPQPGAVITRVNPGSAGDRAGLKSGDVVSMLGAEAVRNAPFLRTRIALLRIGETAELTILREGKEMTVRAIVAERQPQTSSK
ncbi:MAG TPA: trypsin-like peptidase domain-containing protein [Xanthobacteraceae bacterium]|nr:trypsin-like peptidase domain-containing protein [Xanthobacteraceae bacterium]